MMQIKIIEMLFLFSFYSEEFMVWLHIHNSGPPLGVRIGYDVMIYDNILDNFSEDFKEVIIMT